MSLPFNPLLTRCEMSFFFCRDPSLFPKHYRFVPPSKGFLLLLSSPKVTTSPAPEFLRHFHLQKLALGGPPPTGLLDGSLCTDLVSLSLALFLRSFQTPFSLALFLHPFPQEYNSQPPIDLITSSFAFPPLLPFFRDPPSVGLFQSAPLPDHPEGTGP